MDINVSTYDDGSQQSDSIVNFGEMSKDNRINAQKAYREFFDIENWALISYNKEKGIYEIPVVKNGQLLGWKELNRPKGEVWRDRDLNGHEHTRQSAEEFLRRREGVVNGFDLLDQ
ncbi:MAG: hypothetical protein LBB25_02780 [Holosporaceae bacterium]|jgi:hypothetical protein|nr:hypothetical protein [Holosporaceae bacterium]